MTKLESYRKQIDTIDKNILSLLAKRFALSKKIGMIKKQKSINLENKKRELYIIQYVLMRGKKLGVNRAFLTSLWRRIIRESKKIQHKISCIIVLSFTLTRLTAIL